jgi:outer membrane protein TolC
MRSVWCLAVLGTALCLGGCVRYQPKPVSPVAAAAAFEQRNLADPGLKLFLQSNLRHELATWPLPVWDVTNLTLAAFYFSPDLDAARAKWAVAQSGRIIAGERPNPTLSVAPAYDTTTSTPSPWLVTPTLDIPLETAGKRGYRLAEAGHLAEAGRLSIAAAAWQVRSRVRRSLIDLCAARESERLLREQQDLQAENLRLLERQFEAGAISAFEVTQARIAADSTRLATREAERQSAEAREQ